MDIVETWTAAAGAFADLVELVPDDRWTGPGLGPWTLRDLVGHTCSAGLREVVATLDRAPSLTEDIASGADYYAFATKIDRAVYESLVAASTDDARRTGESLGDRPADAVRRWVADAVATVRAAAPEMLVTTAAGGMRLDAWLPTRTFELAVHSLDIAAALGHAYQLPDQVIADAAALAARIGTAIGQGRDVLLALTGRG